MNIFDLESIFTNEVILWRGEYMYECGKVGEIKPTEPDCFTVQVNGSKSYTVNMPVYSNGEIESLSCTCPYAETSRCKHEAAALKALREDFQRLVVIPNIRRNGFYPLEIWINGEIMYSDDSDE